MPTMPGPVELIVILVIVAMLFGVGKLPEVFGAVGKGIREFRTNVADANKAVELDDSSDEEIVDNTEEQETVSQGTRT
jgi:sec-independent protein translocase protein TatA